jgi:uncharacterized glyoxalase superfamily protein PhnB
MPANLITLVHLSIFSAMTLANSSGELGGTAKAPRGSAHILMMRDREQTRLLFERLARGGKVTTALGIQPWGDYYGKLTDRFGVQWMLNCILKWYE